MLIITKILWKIKISQKSFWFKSLTDYYKIFENDSKIKQFLKFIWIYFNLGVILIFQAFIIINKEKIKLD